MISLDTNQLFRKAPSGPLLRMLHKVAQETSHDLVLPQIVAEEYLARYRHDVQVALKQATDAIDKIRHLFPSWPGQVPSLTSVDEAAEEDRRRQLELIFQIHPTPNGASYKALVREARRHPPAKTSWDVSGGGARDVVVWLTILDACRVRGVETYFVSGNSSDFGRDGLLRQELVQDLTDLLGANAHLFHYCNDIPDLMGTLGVQTVQAPADSSIGSAIPVRMAIEAALTDNQAFFEFMSAIPDLPLRLVGGWEGLSELRFERLQDRVEAYRIGESMWACAQGKWSGRRDFSIAWRPEFVPSAQSRMIHVTFTVNATVVMQLNQDGTIAAAEVADRSRLLTTAAEQGSE